LQVILFLFYTSILTPLVLDAIDQLPFFATMKAPSMKHSDRPISPLACKSSACPNLNALALPIVAIAAVAVSKPMTGMPISFLLAVTYLFQADSFFSMSAIA
jgi:hypothetical protein